MKIFIILLATICLSAVFADDESDWEEFKHIFKKRFLSKDREVKRRAAFKRNKAMIAQLKREADANIISYEPAIYSFHDLTPEEIRAQKTGLKVNEEALPFFDAVETRAVTNLPTDYDSRDSLQFNDARDQGECGSCWTFSSVNSLEVGYAKLKNKTIDLSEQQLLDCVYNNDNGCDGGWMSTAFYYLAENNGSVLDADYLYTGVSAKCDITKLGSVKVGNVYQIRSDLKSIKNAIMEFGSLAVAVDADEWSYYGTGVFKARRVGKVNHAVNLVGWGYDDDKKAEYWVIRNSWGSDWGENGYIRIATTNKGSLNRRYIYAVDLVA